MHAKKMNSTPILPALVHQRHSAQVPFPPHWGWLVDELIPAYVKQKYSPQANWKDKPFSQADALFFFKGIEALSELFTEERAKGLSSYFKHPKYRSSYLLYFVPLQAAKFLALFDMYPKALEAAFEHGRKSKILRVADIGAGPGTASLSFLLKLCQLPHPPSVELLWFDIEPNIMKDGIELVNRFCDHFPTLRGKVEIKAYPLPWWKSSSFIEGELSLVLMGNVLNESQLSTQHHDLFWSKLYGKTKGGGILMMEPAARGPSQMISKIRDFIFEKGWAEKQATSIWGPCLHAGICPLAHGRDWCHFSVPTRIPGRWFKQFSVALSSEKQWLKFSYLWLASREYQSPTPTETQRRVISDPLNQGPRATVLLCEPETAKKWSVSAEVKPRRGDLIDTRIEHAEKKPVSPQKKVIIKKSRKKSLDHKK